MDDSLLRVSQLKNSCLEGKKKSLTWDGAAIYRCFLSDGVQLNNQIVQRECLKTIGRAGF